MHYFVLVFPFCVRFLGFILAVVLALHSFLLLSMISLYEYTTICIFIQMLMDIWVVPSVRFL